MKFALTGCSRYASHELRAAVGLSWLTPPRARNLVHSLDAAMAARGSTSPRLCPQHGCGGRQAVQQSESRLRRSVTASPFRLYAKCDALPRDASTVSMCCLVDLQDLGVAISTSSPRCVSLEGPRAVARPCWCSIVDMYSVAARGSHPPPGGRVSRRGPLPMRHGLTMGEIVNWFRANPWARGGLSRIAMEGGAGCGPGFGCPCD